MITFTNDDYYFERTDGKNWWFTSIHSTWYAYQPHDPPTPIVCTNPAKLLYILDKEYYEKVIRALCT